MVVQTIIQIMNAWYSACTLTNIQGGWCIMGAMCVVWIFRVNSDGITLTGNIFTERSATCYRLGSVYTVYVQNTNEWGKPKVCIRFDQSWAIKLLGRELTEELVSFSPNTASKPYNSSSPFNSRLLYIARMSNSIIVSWKRNSRCFNYDTSPILRVT